MAKKTSKAKRGPPQDIVSRGSRAVAKARAETAKIESALATAQRPADISRLQRAETRARQRQTATEARELLTLGIYSPAAPIPTTGPELSAWLTPWRIRQIRKGQREADRLKQDSVFAPFNANSVKHKSAISQQARQIGARVTKAGIFVPREQREMNAPTGRLSFEKSTGLWKVRTSRSYGTREGKTFVRSATMYVAGTEALEAAEFKLGKRLANVELSKNQKMRFLIQGRNISRSSFSNMAELLEYARKYRMNARAQATFIDSLSIVIFEKNDAGRYFRPNEELLTRNRRRALPEAERQEIELHLIERARKRNKAPRKAGIRTGRGH